MFCLLTAHLIQERVKVGCLDFATREVFHSFVENLLALNKMVEIITIIEVYRMVQTFLVVGFWTIVRLK
jgi:alpha-glucuronidase